MKKQKLIISHLFLLLWIALFLWPLTRPYWDWVDRTIFQWLNSSLEGRRWNQLFWALLNRKETDWIVDLICLLLFRAAIVRSQKKLIAVAQSFFSICAIAVVVVLFSCTPLRYLVHRERLSPSLVITPNIRISKEIEWVKCKEQSEQSFPGDHGITLILFALLYAFFTDQKLAIYGWSFAFLFVLPRIVVGAHWFSDIAVGSFSIAFFSFSWITCTPIHRWAVGHLQQTISRLTRSRSSNQSIENRKQISSHVEPDKEIKI